MGFVALGAVVLVIRSMREVVRETLLLVPGRRQLPRLPAEYDAHELEHRTDSAA